ncbi:MAG: hypothetical protein AB7I41_23680 [Candidatus Sericytochromatia bacterium]
MTETLITTNNAEMLQKYLSTLVVGKIIRSLDIEKSNDQKYTDKFLIYLCESSDKETVYPLILWKIYGFREEIQAKMKLCSSFSFCFGDLPENRELPDKYNFDRIYFAGLENDRIEEILHDSNSGFKNAIGESITNISFNIKDNNPKIRIDITSSFFLWCIHIAYDDILYEEEGEFQLNIYYD